MEHTNRAVAGPATSLNTIGEADLAQPIAEPVVEAGKSFPLPTDPYAALRFPNYRRFISGWVFANMGSQMVQMAALWEIKKRTENPPRSTGDPLALGLLGLVQALPVILLALPGGHAADLFDRKRVVLIALLGTIVTSIGLAVASHAAAPLAVIYVLCALSACGKAFQSPARASLLPMLIPPECFQNAVTWNSGIFHFAATAGPIFGGLLLYWTGAFWPVYAVASLFGLVFAFTLLGVHPRAVAQPPRDITLRSMLGGMSFLLEEKTILAAMTLDLMAVLLGGATSLLPIYADDILHVGARGYGILRAAPYVGAVFMALILTRRPPFRHAGRTLLLVVAGYGLATTVFGLSRSFALSLGCLLFAGALDNISVVIRHVLVQARTPDALRGRVSAVNAVFIESSNELGGFESGLVARVFSPVISVVSGGVGTILVVLLIGLKWPEIRRLRTLEQRRD